MVLHLCAPGGLLGQGAKQRIGAGPLRRDGVMEQGSDDGQPQAGHPLTRTQHRSLGEGDDDGID
jgi:hypothetical protein